MGRNVQDGMCRSIYYKQTGVMPEQSLYHAVLSSKEEILNYVVIDTFTPIRFLLSRTYYFPYQWRKLLLEACRVQQPILRNNYLSTLYQEVKDKESHTIITTNSTSAYSLSLDKVVRQFDNIYDNPMLCCLLSYLVRAEATAYPDQFSELYSKGANKEISASQLPTREQQWPARFDEMSVDEYGDLTRGKEKGRYQELIDLRIYGSPSWYADAWQKLYPTPSGNTRYYEATVEISTMFGESE
jgi:hypothetical protein